MTRNERRLANKGLKGAPKIALRRLADRLVRPALVPIYERPDGSEHATQQIGTGFRINCRGRPVLITARHTLFGHDYDKHPEDPWKKHIVFNGRLRGLFELGSDKIFHRCDTFSDDLAAVLIDELGLVGSLPMTCLMPEEATCRLVSIYGLLSRDLRREISTGLLSPTPYLYTSGRWARGSGYTGILMPKHQNIDGRTGMKVQAPRPEGLSGGPMLDAERLSRGDVSIIGVFTDYVQEKGRGFGESSTKVIALLQVVEKEANRVAANPE